MQSQNPAMTTKKSQCPPVIPLMDAVLSALKKIATSDEKKCECALQSLQNYAKLNLSEYLKTLSEITTVGALNPNLREVAASRLRATFNVKDDGLVEVYGQDWLVLGPRYRSTIKTNLLIALGTSIIGSTYVSECIAIIACAELPRGHWPELTTILARNVTKKVENNDNLIFESLEVISYMCQIFYVDQEKYQRTKNAIDVNNSSNIFKAILAALINEKNDCIKLAALNTLPHALEFIAPALRNKVECTALLQITTQLAQSSNSELQLGALNCLEHLETLYYHCIYYMDSTVLKILCNAIASEVKEISHCAIELCDRLCQLQSKMRGGGHRFFNPSALEELLPIVMETFVRRVEENSTPEVIYEDRFLHIIYLISTLSTCCPDCSPVINFFVSVLEANMRNANWCHRYAIVKAFSAIMTIDLDIEQSVDRVLPTLMKLVRDENVFVRNATSTAVVRICEEMLESHMVVAYLDNFLNTLLPCLSAETKVATHITEILAKLSIIACDFKYDKKKPHTYCLSKHFGTIIEALLQASERHDADENLKWTVNRALENFALYSARDCYPTIRLATFRIVEQLLKFPTQQNNVAVAARYNEKAALLCSNLKCLIPTLNGADAREVSEKTIPALLEIVNARTCCTSEKLHELFMRTLAISIKGLGASFSYYIDDFRPYLMFILQDRRPQVVIAGLELMDQVCQSIKKHVIYFCDDVVPLLLNMLNKSDLERNCRERILVTLAKIAETAGNGFRCYMKSTVAMLVALQSEFEDIYNDDTNLDKIHELNSLHRYLLKVYVAIIDSLGDDFEAITLVKKQLKASVVSIVQTIVCLAEDEQCDAYLDICVDQLSDLCDYFDNEVAHVLDTTSISKLLSRACLSPNAHTSAVSNRVARKIVKLKKPTCKCK